MNNIESTCEKCGNKNICWFIKSDIWNKFASNYSVLCPICFVELAENNKFIPTSWELVPENL